MRRIKLLLTTLAAAAVLFSCGQSKKQMTVEDFVKIDMEITTSDQKPETIEAIAKRYGYSLEQYREFDKKVQTDEALQEKLGEIRLGEQKKGQQTE